MNPYDAPQARLEPDARYRPPPGFGQRVMATVADIIVSMMVFLGAVALGVAGLALLESRGLIATEWWLNQAPGGVVTLVGLHTWLTASALSEWVAGVTPGKQMFNLRVVQEGPSPRISLGAALLRNGSKLFESVPFGLPARYAMARNDKGQRFGDQLVGTRVVRAQEAKFRVPVWVALGVGQSMVLVTSAIVVALSLL